MYNYSFLFMNPHIHTQTLHIHTHTHTHTLQTYSQSRHMEFNFPFNAGSGIAPLLRHGSTGCVDLISQLCTYDPEERLNAKEALKHPYFKELRQASMMFALQKIATIRVHCSIHTLYVENVHVDWL